MTTSEAERLPCRQSRRQLDAALDAVGGIHKKYYRLRHPGEALGGLTPLVSPGWVQMFQTAWMAPGFALPDWHDLNPP